MSCALLVFMIRLLKIVILHTNINASCKLLMGDDYMGRVNTSFIKYESLSKPGGQTLYSPAKRAKYQMSDSAIKSLISYDISHKMVKNFSKSINLLSKSIFAYMMKVGMNSDRKHV